MLILFQCFVRKINLFINGQKVDQVLPKIITDLVRLLILCICFSWTTNVRELLPASTFFAFSTIWGTPETTAQTLLRSQCFLTAIIQKLVHP